MKSKLFMHFEHNPDFEVQARIDIHENDVMDVLKRHIMVEADDPDRVTNVHYEEKDRYNMRRLPALKVESLYEMIENHFSGPSVKDDRYRAHGRVSIYNNVRNGNTVYSTVLFLDEVLTGDWVIPKIKNLTFVYRVPKPATSDK